MLRIATWFESRLGRNDGNPLFITAALKRIQYYGGIISGKGEDQSLLKWFNDKVGGDPVAAQIAKDIWDKHHETIEVDHLAPNGEENVFGHFDLNIHVDWGEDALTSILPYKVAPTPHPFVYWASDTHINNGLPGDSYPYRLGIAKTSDYVFVAQKAGLEKMKADGVANATWLPHAVEPQAYPKQAVASKRYDACFVGNINSANRADALDRLFREFPNFYYGQLLFDQAAEKFGESKIVFNIAMTDDVNMRCYEALGTGSFLLTNRIPGIEEIFTDAKHLVLYNDLDEMVEKAKYYLDHDEEREAIAKAGYEEVMAKHTINHRVKTILDNSLFAAKKELATA